MEEKEMWRDIVGYEELYQVSDFGRIKSLKRNIGTNGKTITIYNEKIIKPSKTKDGYLFVGIYKNGNRKLCRVSRLVAEAFIPNDDIKSKTQVNHIKEFEKTNNHVSNLEWTTPKDNINYGTHNARQAKAKSKLVYQYSLEGELVKEWPSATKCESDGFQHSAISLCCNNMYLKRKNIYKGYIWRYSKA
jgi:hypothetical protein